MSTQNIYAYIQRQQPIYDLLVQSVAEYVIWSSVEGVSLQQLKAKLCFAQKQAEAAGLTLDEIQTALQVGESRGRFELT